MPIHDQVRDATIDVLQLYHTHTARAFAANCIEKGDDLHTTLLLEMRSAMTHMSKAVCCEEGTLKKRLEQLNDAKDHLIRASLDSYKIAYYERTKKLTKRYRVLSKHNTLPQALQARYDGVIKQRKILSDSENTVITGADTLEGYRSAYADSYDLFDDLVNEYPDRAVAIQSLKNILLDSKLWVSLIIGTILGMCGSLAVTKLTAQESAKAESDSSKQVEPGSDKPEALKDLEGLPSHEDNEG